jgi:hypothetical protein
MKRFDLWVGALTAASTVGCFVPERQYDQAVHTLRAEQAGHRKTAERLHGIRKKLAIAEGKLEKEHGHITAREGELAQSKLDYYVVSTEREDAVRMVEQLRGELARVGDHLKAFSEQKNSLETALDDAEERARELERLETDFAQKARLMRDLAYALHDDLTGDLAAIDVDDGTLRIRFDAGATFEGTSVRKEPADALRRLAAATAPLGQARLELTEHPADPAYRAEDSVVRLQAVADVLSKGGVPFRRITTNLPSEPSAGEPVAAEMDSDIVDAPPPVPVEIAPVKAPTPGAGSWMDGPGSLEIVIRFAAAKDMSK